ncbi:MAG TPA: hypothetical protein PK992_08500 [Planctomycetaceae bacterium]|mgnify:CR=1 FL=1|nr:hypothetical protein [Planctomycetaceae bacterium]
MTKYRVAVDDFEELAELENGWNAADYVSILKKQGVDGAAQIAPEELREMCLLALQDLDPPEAANVLLTYKLGTKLSEGQIRNYSIESQHERLWEQAGDLEFHHTMFNVASLLNAVNGSEFPTPDALRVSLSIETDDVANLAVFEDSMDRALLVRLLSAGMDGSAILNRLFGDQIATGEIADANSIIWGVAVDSSEKTSIRLKITSSAYWLSAIRGTESFEWDSELAT